MVYHLFFAGSAAPCSFWRHALPATVARFEHVQGCDILEAALVGMGECCMPVFSPHWTAVASAVLGSGWSKDGRPRSVETLAASCRTRLCGAASRHEITFTVTKRPAVKGDADDRVCPGHAACVQSYCNATSQPYRLNSKTFFVS